LGGVIGSADLVRGGRGEGIRDLQGRLHALGYGTGPDEPGTFADGTDAAVRRFQDLRGLRVDGIVGRQTWSALVESGFTLGDRHLYERRPMLRGDDVGELQRRLNALGFDAGREDAIFGPRTAAALREFQRNAGLGPDGIAGPETLATLRRVGALSAGSVATVREREALRRPRRLEGRRVYLSVSGGLVTLGSTVARALRAAGAHPLVDTAAVDPSVVAAQANRFDADLCFAFRAGVEAGCHCSYFENASFRSEAGYQVAVAVQREIATVIPGDPGDVRGRTFGLLRETRMAAVVCEPGGAPDDMARLVARVPEVAAAVGRGIRLGMEEPVV
jgi:N-acetylmuramoyl-L-alanine amidase